MTMHEHDTDLIMALAEGTLDPDRAAAAEADLASCPTCTEDLSLQRAALALLSAAPPATMNDIERARIRRTVRSELGIAPVAAAAPPARRYRLFAALAGVAAVLLAFVVVAPGLDLLGGDDDGAADVTFALATETTSAGDVAAAPESQANDLRAMEDAGDGAMAGGADAATTTAPMTPTAAPVTTRPPADAGLGYTLWSAEELEELPDLTALADELTAAGSIEAVVGPRELATDDRIIAAASDPRCIAAGGGIAPDAEIGYVIGVAGINDVEVFIVAYVEGDFEAVTVVAQDIETCKVLATSG
jgi:anti-sigma factor RsiW